MAMLGEIVGLPAWNPEVLHAHTKNTFLHFSKQKASSFESPRGHGTRERRSRSDITDGGPKLVAISPLLCAAAAPGAPPSLVPVDEAAHNRPRLFEFSKLEDFESPLALSPDAAARHLPDFLNEYSMDDDTQGPDADKGDFPPMTPSPLLHASLHPERFQGDFFGSSACGWELGPSLCKDSTQGFAGWEGNPDEALAAAGWEGNCDEAWSLEANGYWDQAAGAAGGYSGWGMPWEQTNCGEYAYDASGWANSGSGAWNEGDAGADTINGANQKQDSFDTPEKILEKKSRAQKKDRTSMIENEAEEGRTCELAGNPTTVMLRNIPNKFMPETLAKQLTRDYKGMFDFMYLPIDFKNKCNVGYSFINFRSPELCSKFVRCFNGVQVMKCLPGFNSRKIVEVTPARVQGLQENVKRLRNSPVMAQLQENPEWLPLIFDEEGSSIPFPEPDQPLAPVRPRGGRHKDVQK